MNKKRLVIFAFLGTFLFGLFAGIFLSQFDFIIKQKIQIEHRFIPERGRGNLLMWQFPGFDPEILDELVVTRQQREKIDTILKDSRTQMRNELKQVHQKMAQSGKEISDEIIKVLDSGQQKKYKEFIDQERLNFPPPVFVLNMDELNLTFSQREQIEDILEKQSDDLRLGYRKFRKRIAIPMEVVRSRIDSVLTPEQRLKMRELVNPRKGRHELKEKEERFPMKGF